LIPSADSVLYAIDLLTAGNLWSFPSGAPIGQAPVVAGEDILVLNERGNLSQLDPATGSLRWTTPTQGGQFVSVSNSKIYLRSYNNDLYEIDRASGKVLADPAATLQRAGLNLREYGLSLLNRFDDRMYFGTNSGMIVCLREIGADRPQPLRDPKALPFGYIPPEGIKPAPRTAPPAETAAETEGDTKDAAAKDAADAPAPDDKDKPAPEPDEPKAEKPEQPQ
jgi:hypothetical protein